MMNMRTTAAAAAVLIVAASTAHAFQSPLLATTSRSSRLAMVLEKPPAKKLAKIEQLKVDSDHLIHPLKEVGFVILSWLVDLANLVQRRCCWRLCLLLLHMVEG